MQKFELLIIGDLNSQYIQNFTIWIKNIWPGLSVKAINTGMQKIGDNKHDVFDATYESLNHNNRFQKRPIINTLFRAFNVYLLIQNNKLGRDSILFHFAAPWISVICKALKNKTNNICTALWGDDYSLAKSKFLLKKIFKASDQIIIGTPQMIDNFKQNYNTFFSKVSLCYFGNEPIERLKELKENNIEKKDSCKHLNLSSRKIIIAIGYCGVPSQKHIQVIQQLSKLDRHILDHILLVLPMTYGLTQDYLAEIKIQLETLKTDSVIFDNYLTEKEVAHLRNATDIMINVQQSDAFSGSMREVLYCGGVVVCGSWLPYSFLKNIGIYFEELDSINSLSEKIKEIINNLSILKEKNQQNKELIYKMSSWSMVIPAWKEVIERNYREPEKK